MNIKLDFKEEEMVNFLIKRKYKIKEIKEPVFTKYHNDVHKTGEVDGYKILNPEDKNPYAYMDGNMALEHYFIDELKKKLLN